MTTESDDLVSLFAAKLRLEGKLVEVPAPGAQRLLVNHGSQRLTIVLPDGPLRRLLAEGDELATDLWGSSASAQEAAARLMTVHLLESLDSSADDNLEGTWTYVGGFLVRS